MEGLALESSGLTKREDFSKGDLYDMRFFDNCRDNGTKHIRNAPFEEKLATVWVGRQAFR